MSIDFPAAPTIGQKYPSPSVVGVPTYTWDGEKWGVAPVSGGKTPVYPDGSAAMAAQLTVVNPPVSPTDAASKAYVDSGDANSVKITAQSPTAAQQAQASTNVYAAPFDAMAYSGMQTNGDVCVSQEYGTTSIWGGPAGTTVLKYIADGWRVASAGGPSISWAADPTLTAATGGLPPPGYPNAVSVWTNDTTASPVAGAYLFVNQFIEAQRFARLSWGTGTAQPMSIGFWVAAHVSGNYSGSVRNTPATQSYVFDFTISAVDTWEWKTVTVPGCTAGTWTLMEIDFTLMTGSSFKTAAAVWTAGSFIGSTTTINGAANANRMSITGLIILPGIELPNSNRAALIMRPYPEELLICSRYFQFNRYAESGDFFNPYMNFWHIPVVNYRASPTVSLASGSFYVEIPWAAGINVTGGSVNNSSRVSASGGEYLLQGTYSYTPTYNQSIAFMSVNGVKFNARLGDV